MNLVKGNVFSFKGDYLLITSCGWLNAKGELVMGRGTAKEAKLKWPTLPRVFGDMIHEREYNLIWAHGFDPYLAVGAFQTKYHYGQPADLDLIDRSTEQLCVVAQVFADGSFGMPLPGAGFGHLSRDQVLPVIDRLPNNVFVYDLT